MAKRGYKLQEFVAHSSDVNCVKIGKKGGRLLVTGGDDNKVNLWSIGRPAPLMSLSGHTTSVESVAFDSSELLIVAGASTGVIKLWDVEEAKIVRSITAHRSCCTAVEFHPFGEFLASGSMDTNLRIWDIRKKGCIHTYKGHTRGISNIRFTPDGRRVVSGGHDNVVKVWDLTAGKLLHDFKSHEGHIRSIDFHPLEFLLATGSADRTVKFWDLETFELIGSTRPEATGVRSITFHPDGKTLFCGLDDRLKVYSWEPVICHDAIDLGWSTLGDLCTHEGKLLGCSYYRNSVGVWVADISLIDQFGSGLVPEENVGGGKNFDILGSHSLHKREDGIRSTMGLHSMFPECEEIKNIYVDCAGKTNVTREKVGSLNSPKDVFSLEPEANSDLTTQKEVPTKVVHMKTNEQGLDNTDILVKPAYVHSASLDKYDVNKPYVAVESGSLTNMISVKESAADPNFHTRLKVNDEAKESFEDKYSNIKSVMEKFDRVLSPQKSMNQVEANDESTKFSNEISNGKFVNGVSVIRGRIRSLVERFERHEICSTTDDQAIDKSVTVASEIDKPQTEKTPTMLRGEILISEMPEPTSAVDQIKLHISETESTSSNDQRESQISENKPTCANDQREQQISENKPLSANDQRREPQSSERELTPAKDQRGQLQISQTRPISANYQRGRCPMFGRDQSSPNDQRGPRICGREPVSANDQRGARLYGRVSTSANDQGGGARILRRRPTSASAQIAPRKFLRQLTSTYDQREPHISGREPTHMDDQIRELQICERESTSANDQNLTEELLQTHDVFLSTLQSRLIKLQVVRHFWRRRDIKGALNSLRKLPDHSVQADVVSVLIEKAEILTLDLFSHLLPVLEGLLDSKTERHANISLEMLLKLVALFGPVISSTISAPPSVGVDLQAEQRLECCKKCFARMQKIQKILPLLIRRGGLLARCSRELNMLLQQL